MKFNDVGAASRWGPWPSVPDLVTPSPEAEALKAIGGRFVLSINDTPLAREVFGRFQLEAVPVTYTIGTASGRGQRAGELIVSKGARRGGAA